MSLKKHSVTITLTIGFMALINTVVFGRAEIGEAIYLDRAQPVDNRVEDLLSRMTLEEKVGQINLVRDLNQPQTIEFVKGQYKVEQLGIGPGGGFLGLAKSKTLSVDTRQRVEFLNKLQKTAIEETRLGIPLIIVEDGTHGLMAQGATVFPEGLAIASSWDMDLVKEIYAAVAKEARRSGVHHISTIVIEPDRDPRLGRNQEAYSEDTYLSSRIAEVLVQATQGRDISDPDSVVPVLSHYPGQTQAVGGLEFGAMEISERCLREVFLPVWEAGITKAGALSVMATYPAIDGEATHGSYKLLTKILREELGFEGYVYNEGGGFKFGLIENRVAANQKEAGRLAINAGVDVNMRFEAGFMKLLIENVREGKVSMETVNRAVRRFLRVKFLLGLFENPYVDVDCALKVVHCKEHQDLALRSAREGIVLLKNEKNLLPLDKKIKSIAVIGPNANHKRNQLGDYVVREVLQDVVTVYQGIKNKVSPDTNVVYVKGCDVFTTDSNEIRLAQQAAAGSDIAIVVVGENERYGENGTNGEGCDVASLDLTGLQEDLVKAVYQTGVPTIVVLINGRPLSIRWIAEHVPVILEAWICGEQGGNAVADVLFGDYNPSGRLPISVPRHVGQLPIYYNYKPPKHSYVDMSSTPLFEFGYGLSYTKFEYSNLQIMPKPPAQKFGTGSEVYVSVDVKNVGKYTGAEVVQLYIDDCISSVVTPVMELKGFEKIMLEPGQVKKVEFTLTPYQLSLLNANLERVVEPGVFEVMVGSSCKDIRLKGKFEVE